MNKVKISKTMSYILRHHPEKFNLHINPDGTIKFNDLLRKLKIKFNYINKKSIIDIVKNDSKKRFSFINGKGYIRANYGHSIDGVHPEYENVKPPERLFHGTAKRNIKSIKNKGLIPRNRNFVHLSKTKTEAKSVGKRHDPSPIILEVNSKKIRLKWNINFYKAGTVYLCREIPPRFITFPKE